MNYMIGSDYTFDHDGQTYTGTIVDMMVYDGVLHFKVKADGIYTQNIPVTL